MKKPNDSVGGLTPLAKACEAPSDATYGRGTVYGEGAGVRQFTAPAGCKDWEVPITDDPAHAVLTGVDHS